MHVHILQTNQNDILQGLKTFHKVLPWFAISLGFAMVRNISTNHSSNSSTISSVTSSIDSSKDAICSYSNDSSKEQQCRNTNDRSTEQYS